MVRNAPEVLWMSAGIALLVRNPGECHSHNADRLPFGSRKRDAGIVHIAGQDLFAFCRADVSVGQPGDPRSQASVAGESSFDPVLLGVSNEIPEYRPSLLYTHLAHALNIHEVKDVKVSGSIR